jgi:very-short-patch-repair endonuclease
MSGLRQQADLIIARIAAVQHGAVCREQLLAAGLTSRMIELRVRKGLLVPVHRGVYLVAYASAPLREHSAALLACRPHAMLSRFTAASLLGLPVRPPVRIQVTVVGRFRKPPAGVESHRIVRLAPGELTYHEGLPMTSPSLTILDLAADLTRWRLAEVINEARVQGLVSDRDLAATLAAHPNRRGRSALRALLSSERGPRITRSEAERRALATMRAHGIEPDETDVQIGPYRADFLFRRERLIVEIDGYRYHGTPKRFVGDRRRAAYLAGRGFMTFPLTWQDLGPNSARAMGDLRAALAKRRSELAA